MKTYVSQCMAAFMATLLILPAAHADPAPSFFEYTTGGLTYKKAALAAGIGIAEGVLLAPLARAGCSPERVTVKSVASGVLAVGLYNLPPKTALYRAMAEEVTILDSQRFKEHGFLFDTGAQNNPMLRFESLCLIETVSALATLAAGAALLDSRHQ